MDDAALKAATEQWRTEGWVLLDSLIPRVEIDRAMEEVRALEIPEPTGPMRRADVAATEPRFREAQFVGTTLFPLPKAPHLNRLFVHPAMIGFAKAALGMDDIRIYQSRLWSKDGDQTNYAQPLHRDLNHSLVPNRFVPGYWYMETFLYLTDVDERNGAPMLVPRSQSVGEPEARTPIERDDQPALYGAEISAPGPAGSLLAYRSDVWHRGTDLEPGAERHVAVVAFKPAGLEWIGFDSHAPLVNSSDFVAFVNECSPEELALFGIPRPGDEYWTPAVVDELAQIYPGLDIEPWRTAL